MSEITPYSDQEADFLLLGVQADPEVGRQLLADAWPEFFNELCALLHRDGREEATGLEELRIFRYPAPAPALSSFYHRLKQLKQKVKWDSSLGPAPLRLLLHWDDAPRPPHFADPSPEQWSALERETPYLSSRLHAKWLEVADHEKLHHYRPGEEEQGLFPLRPLDNRYGKPDPLFPYRCLPLAGKMTPCFYCGMTNHLPASCPSKALTMQTQGLVNVGYLPLNDLAELFREAMERRGELNNLLLGGIRPGQLRKDPLLQTYVSYFDLNKVYQPRFLTAIAFTLHSRWQALGTTEGVSGDNSSFHLGLDCLRVGQYQQADELFITEGRRPKGKGLYAAVGRALVSLEQKRYQDMGHYLESALKAAITDRDRIYILLLLARYYRLIGDNWKASQALDKILSFDRECIEANYRQLQHGVAEGFANQILGRLRSLIGEEKELFIHCLMDPELISIQEAVEDILRARLATLGQEAEESLAKARVICQEMAAWLGEEDETLKEMRADLAIIEEHEERKSYYDLIDITEKSRRLIQQCYRTQEAKLDELHRRLEKTAHRLEGFNRFWKFYPYQSLFPEFEERKKEVEELVGKTSREGTGNLNGELYRKLINSLDESDGHFERLKELTAKMVWVKSMMEAGKRFLKTLVIAEVVLLLLTVTLLVGLATMGGDQAVVSGVSRILAEPEIQKRLLLVITLVLAPLAALTHTVWRL